MQEDALPNPITTVNNTPVANSLLPPITLISSSSASTELSNHMQQALTSLKLAAIPPHPSQRVLQRGGDIKVDITYLHLDQEQKKAISFVYDSCTQFHQLFTNSDPSRKEAAELLGSQGLDMSDLDDLSNRWSIRWSKLNGKAKKHKRCLLQCQCGSNSQARKVKDDVIKIKQGDKIFPQEWQRKTPYDFTGCLAHLDITFDRQSFDIIRITGIMDHNSACEKQEMQRLPPVPLHPHVWQLAIQQLNTGASISAIQEMNRQWCRQELYEGQSSVDPKKANIRYLFLPQDTSRLYKMHARTQGVDLSQPPERNVDAWLDSSSAEYKPELAAAIFHYKARHNPSERFKICIQTKEMKDAAWKYAHGRQLILDGTFGICDRRLLLFIGMAIDHKGKGVPIVFLLFSAPSGSQATHAGYDTDILAELLRAWASDLGKGPQGASFAPKVVITDTDTKERGALIIVWPSIFLLLCKFHVRNAWANKRKTLIKMGTVMVFEKEQVMSRLRALDHSLIVTEDYKAAQELVQKERSYLSMMLTNPDATSAAKSGQEYLDYLVKTWFSKELWQSWSQHGRNQAANILGVPIHQVAPTTNHLEAFNGVLKRKHIRQFQKGGRRVHFDLLIFLLVKRILPGIFEQRAMEDGFHDWLAQRFSQAAGGNHLVRTSQMPPKADNKADPMKKDHQFCWWSEDSRVESDEEVAFIIQKKRLGDFKWLDTFTLVATCASKKEDMRLLSHTRYILLMSCYGWATCSCPRFLKYGSACKHLWAMRHVVIQMQAPYAFLFPQTQEEACRIHTTLYGPSAGQSFEGILLPTLVDDPTRPEPLINHSGRIVCETDEIIDSFGENESEGESEDEDEMLVIDTELLERNKSAVTKQLQVRLNHEHQHTVPKLFGIQALLHQLGPNVAKSPHLQELHELSHSLSEYLNSLPIETTAKASSTSSVQNIETKPTQPKIPSGQLSKAPVKRTALVPPSPERSQKRKRSTAIF
ncbi:hypothetical protein M422DRAFT_258067 [Sphaerobolus stellatus SS14]|uniref:SWIM-type domain-containing protein n=1 Tax=Sphaerobolus stellatus (strain SS14) TaxID=990650 RepID=A0A0C9VC90_SPHS4|nr:hypothetical protein M422DRAFT_258067 [Sphaerobolus stellatus SS14]